MSNFTFVLETYFHIYYNIGAKCVNFIYYLKKYRTLDDDKIKLKTKLIVSIDICAAVQRKHVLKCTFGNNQYFHMQTLSLLHYSNVHM